MTHPEFVSAGIRKRAHQLATVGPFNRALAHMQTAADHLSARCFTHEHVLQQEKALERLEQATKELREALEQAKAVKD